MDATIKNDGEMRERADGFAVFDEFRPWFLAGAAHLSRPFSNLSSTLYTRDNCRIVLGAMASATMQMAAAPSVAQTCSRTNMVRDHAF